MWIRSAILWAQLVVRAKIILQKWAWFSIEGVLSR
jgi:hypothetical protein